VSLGPFRLAGDAFKAVVRLYPEDALFAGPLEEEDGHVAYRREIEEEMLGFCTGELLRHVPEEIFFPGLSLAPAVPPPASQAEGGPVS
jgi:spore photoproduct lyase